MRALSLHPRRREHFRCRRVFLCVHRDARRQARTAERKVCVPLTQHAFQARPRHVRLDFPWAVNPALRCRSSIHVQRNVEGEPVTLWQGGTLARSDRTETCRMERCRSLAPCARWELGWALRRAGSSAWSARDVNLHDSEDAQGRDRYTASTLQTLDPRGDAVVAATNPSPPHPCSRAPLVGSQGPRRAVAIGCPPVSGDGTGFVCQHE